MIISLPRGWTLHIEGGKVWMDDEKAITERLVMEALK